jgi:hypothetical protein
MSLGMGVRLSEETDKQQYERWLYFSDHTLFSLTGIRAAARNRHEIIAGCLNLTKLF